MGIEGRIGRMGLIGHIGFVEIGEQIRNDGVEVGAGLAGEQAGIADEARFGGDDVGAFAGVEHCWGESHAALGAQGTGEAGQGGVEGGDGRFECGVGIGYIRGIDSITITSKSTSAFWIGG